MTPLVHNERLKLTATYVNGLAIAVFAVGGFAPILNFIAASIAPGYAVACFVVICFPLSFALHLLARRMLEDLKNADD